MPTGVLLLLADKATDHVTGRTVNTDGGMFRAAAGARAREWVTGRSCKQW
ncbi:hypothetical protein [Streptomyces flaveolus]